MNTHQKLSYKIALVGYAGVGKTTIANLIRSKEIPIEHDSMTKGDIATLKIGKLKFNIWDYTGEEQFSFLWEEFVKGSDEILLITDSSVENVEKSKFFLNIIKNESPQAVAAVICNKQDLENTLEPEKIENILGLKVYPMIAIDQNRTNELILIITDLLKKKEEVSHQIKLLSEREKLKDELEQILKENNFEKASYIIGKIIDLCVELEDEVLRKEFYEMDQKLNEKIKENVTFQETSVQEISSKERLLKSLIENYMNEIESISSVILTDREGKIIFSESKKESGIESTIGLPEKIGISDEIKRSFVRVICPICKTNKRIAIPKYIIDDAINVVTFSIPKKLVCEHHFQVFVDKNLAVRGYQSVDYEFDGYLDKIIKDISNEENYCNVITTEEKKLAYCSRGPKSVLTTITSPSISDVKLRVFSEHIAGKAELILEGYDNVEVEIPQLIRTLSKTKEGTLPKGNFAAKIIMTGNYKVGKTSLVNRFVRNLFEESYQSTIGVDISKKLVELNNETKIKFVIWDIGGQISQIAPYRKRFYEGANYAIIVIDRTRQDNKKNVDIWYNDIKKSVSTDINFILIGNKSDLVENITTSEEEIKEIADRYGFNSYILTSAKTGENVNDAFSFIAYTFLESI